MLTEVIYTREEQRFMNDFGKRPLDDDELDTAVGGVQTRGGKTYLCFCKKCKKFVGPYNGGLPKLFNETISQFCPNCREITTQEITETNLI